MADPRFFSRQSALTLTDLATLTGAQLQSANPNHLIEDVASLSDATSSHLSFLDNPKYADAFAASHAGAAFVRSKYQDRAPAGMALLLSEDPYRCYAVAAAYFYPPQIQPTEISASAAIAPSAKIGQRVRIESGVVIGERAEIADDVTIGANSVIGDGVVIGQACRIGSLCSLSYCIIGRNAIIHPGVHIGQDGFGFAMGRGGHLKVPQLGRVMIGHDVEIGSGTCIDRGSGPDTIIGDGSKIDNLVQIGHNVQLGRGCVIVSQVGISGSTHFGDGVVVGGQAGIAGHLQIGSGAMLAARTGVMQNLDAGKTYGGTPAMPIKDWHRQVVALNWLIKPTKREES